MITVDQSGFFVLFTSVVRYNIVDIGPTLLIAMAFVSYIAAPPGPRGAAMDETKAMAMSRVGPMSTLLYRTTELKSTKKPEGSTVLVY